MAVKIFFCYAHQDEGMLNKLKSHLRPLQRGGLIEIWYDREISSGTEWEPEISQHLNTAQIILLLISRNFMNSDYCYSIEMKRAIERHERGEVCVIPVILRPVHWQVVPIDKLQALPKDAKPITDWTTQDHGLRNVTEGIFGVIKQLNVNHPAKQASTSSPLSTSLDDRFQWWDKDQIALLKREVRNPTVLSLLNLTAERAEEWVTYDEVYENAGRTAGQAKGDLSNFTQLIKRHFKQNVKGWWPVDVQLGKPIKYRMPSAIAQHWKEARSS
jgi:TIR domain